MTKRLARPSTAVAVLRRVPSGVRKAFRIRAATARALGAGAPVPGGAALVEFAGYLTGPDL